MLALGLGFLGGSLMTLISVITGFVMGNPVLMKRFSQPQPISPAKQEQAV